MRIDLDTLQVLWWYLVVLFITWHQLSVCCIVLYASFFYFYFSVAFPLLFIYWLSDIQQSGSAYWKMYVFFIWCAVAFYFVFVFSFNKNCFLSDSPKKDETRSHMWLTNTVNRFRSQKSNRRAKCASTIDTLNDSNDNDENGTYNVAENQKKNTHISRIIDNISLSCMHTFVIHIVNALLVLLTVALSEVLKAFKRKEASNGKCALVLQCYSESELLLLIISPFNEYRNNRWQKIVQFTEPNEKRETEYLWKTFQCKIEVVQRSVISKIYNRQETRKNINKKNFI